MLNWLARRRSSPGWLAASLGDTRIEFVRGRPIPAGAPRISAFGDRAIDARTPGPGRLAAELNPQHHRCTTLLRTGEYHLLLVDAPNVPAEEMKSAVRWRIKDMIDYRIDDAALDVLEIPPEAAGSARARLVYVVCARNDTVRRRVQAFQAARLPLAVIEIPETAQRNVAALYEEEGRALALAYFGDDWGMVTINHRAELMLARRFDFGLKLLGAQDAAARADARERAVLELQRTFDHFDRQFGSIALSRLYLAPTPTDLGLAAELGASLALPVATVDLAATLHFDGPAPDAPTQWRLFHQFGAVLRQEVA